MVEKCLYSRNFEYIFKNFSLMYKMVFNENTSSFHQKKICKSKKKTDKKIIINLFSSYRHLFLNPKTMHTITALPKKITFNLRDDQPCHSRNEKSVFQDNFRIHHIFQMNFHHR